MEILSIILVILLLLSIFIGFWIVNNKFVKSIQDSKGVTEKEDTESLIN